MCRTTNGEIVDYRDSSGSGRECHPQGRAPIYRTFCRYRDFRIGQRVYVHGEDALSLPGPGTVQDLDYLGLSVRLDRDGCIVPAHFGSCEPLFPETRLEV